VRLTAHVTGGRPLYWIIEGPDGHVRHAGTPLEHRFPGAGRYGVRLVAASDSGCPAEARLELTFEAVPIESWLDLPNAFTPNGDGTNEVYTFSVNQLRAWRFSVYDRWNNLAYEVDAPALPAWDGQLRWGGTAPEGVYIYRLTGETHGGETVHRTGSIHVVR
jgi:gliding motility-associated-like protein